MIAKIKFIVSVTALCAVTETSFSQNPLFIPDTMSGTVFNLNIQNGTTQFYPGINTPTFGINGSLLAPTLIVNKGDGVTMNVTNNLTGNSNSTTIHWHGLHVPPEDDGGPHQIIEQGATWSPSFQILNTAGTFWYHPHGEGKTERHVSKGIAGMIIIRDSVEASLTLPRSYGIDDFPIIVQTKAFDVLNQIAVATEDDTALFVNGTLNSYLDAPAQIIRLRMLNGSSSRTYNFGFTGNMAFKMIASDGGLLDSAITLTRLRLSPGERAELLLDLQGLQGQTIYLNSFSSEMPNGIHGAATVTGMMGGTIPGYDLNFLNGADFQILQINVTAQTANPVTSIPTILTSNTPWVNYTVSRNFSLAPDTMMNAQQQVEGPFNINGEHFNMEVINETVILNTVEKWRITNQTGIAHPFHIHDIQFYLLNVNGGAVPNYMQGKKDVVLVMPMQYVEVITKFEDFANDTVPYMYHCHLLHHEDDGMMGSFVVIDTTTSLSENNFLAGIKLFPNPATNEINVSFSENPNNVQFVITDITGQIISSGLTEFHQNNFTINCSQFARGTYFLQIVSDKETKIFKIIKQ